VQTLYNYCSGYHGSSVFMIIMVWWQIRGHWLLSVVISSGHIRFIHDPRRSVCVHPSDSAVLKCDVKATPTAKITWLKNGKNIPKTDHHYLMFHEQSHDQISSVLIIYDTTATDQGWYTCLASNSAVNHRTHTYVKVSQCGMLLSPSYCVFVTPSLSYVVSL